MKTLKDVQVGETAVIKKLHGAGAIKRRIMDDKPDQPFKPDYKRNDSQKNRKDFEFNLVQAYCMQKRDDQVKCRRCLLCSYLS